MWTQRIGPLALVLGLAVPPRAAAQPSQAEIGASWFATAMQHRGRNGEQFQYNCLPQASLRIPLLQAQNVWGTDHYADASAVCAAAVHAGLITTAGGGSVYITIEPGLSFYVGSTRNGQISLSSAGPYPGSFSFAGSGSAAVHHTPYAATLPGPASTYQPAAYVNPATRTLSLSWQDNGSPGYAYRNGYWLHVYRWNPASTAASKWELIYSGDVGVQAERGTRTSVAMHEPQLAPNSYYAWHAIAWDKSNQSSPAWTLSDWWYFDTSAYR